MAGCSSILSFDYDADSVQCTEVLRQNAGDPSHWRVQQGSVLDATFMSSLGEYDVVYSWGVLHHTGDQWRAIQQAKDCVKPGGLLYIALYTSEVFPRGRAEMWIKIKKLYNTSHPFIQRLLVWLYAALHCCVMVLRGVNPYRFIRTYSESRGMNYLIDVRDWLGGFPMEFSSINEVVKELCRKSDFALINLKYGEANTEYLFRRNK